jgi:hypothetical protein
VLDFLLIIRVTGAQPLVLERCKEQRTGKCGRDSAPLEDVGRQGIKRKLNIVDSE